MKTATALGLIFALIAAAGPARAQVTQTDVLVAGRAIGFVEKFAAGELTIGIVFASDSAQSTQQANELRAILGNRFRVGNHVLRASLVRMDELSEADVDLFFLTQGVGGAASRVALVSRERKVPCITFDLAQVRNGACVVGVQSRPRVEVLVNRKAAAASATVFSDVFRLMITEY